MDKILEKNPTNQEAIDIKGLSILGLVDKETAEKLIKYSIKLGMKNSKVLLFYAFFHKELKIILKL